MLRDDILSAKDRSGLDDASFCALAGLSTATLQAWRDGAAHPDVDEADRAARVFGARLADLHGAGGWPLEPFLFKSRSSAGLQALIESGSYATFGELLRVAADIAEIEAALARPRVALPTVDPIGTPAAIAHRIRNALSHSPGAPIKSMRALVERAGVRVLFETSDRMHASFEGASTLTPRPLILVNTDPGARSGWARIRMVIAHELTHLLLDHEGPSVSTAGLAGVLRFSEPYANLESRADAVAANLLAPEASVRSAVAGMEPSSASAIAVIGRTFGVGKHVAVNRLTDVFGLAAPTRERMLEQRVNWQADFSADVPQDDEIGLRTATVQALVTDALAVGALDRVRAHGALGLALSQPLPDADALGDAARAQLRGWAPSP